MKAVARSAAAGAATLAPRGGLLSAAAAAAAVRPPPGASTVRRWQSAGSDGNAGVRETTTATELRADQRRQQLRAGKAAGGSDPAAHRPPERAAPRRQAPHQENRFTTTTGRRESGAAPGTREADPAVVPTVSFLGWATWNRDGRLPHAVQDQQMDKAAQAAFGPTARAATWEEYEGNLVSGSPALNESDLWLHFTGAQGHGYDNGKGYQWKKCVWRKRTLDGQFSEDSCSARYFFLLCFALFFFACPPPHLPSPLDCFTGHSGRSPAFHPPSTVVDRSFEVEFDGFDRMIFLLVLVFCVRILLPIVCITAQHMLGHGCQTHSPVAERGRSSDAKPNEDVF